MEIIGAHCERACEDMIYMCSLKGSLLSIALVTLLLARIVCSTRPLSDSAQQSPTSSAR